MRHIAHAAILLLVVSGLARAGAPPVRVLYVEQAPRWEYRHLQRALTEDRGLWAHVLLTSAGPGYVQPHSSHGHGAFAHPIAGLPRTFEDHYDVVVLGDVSPGELPGTDTPARLARFVRRGGGLVLLAGERTGTSGYGPALSPLLPVTLMGAAPTGAGTLELVHDGRVDPAAAPMLTRDGQPSELRWLMRSRLRPGALVAAVCRVGGVPYPLIVHRAAGRGRVAWVATDETWRWRGAAAEGWARMHGALVREVAPCRR